MSMAGLGFLGSDTEDDRHPQFSRVLKGFDSEEVDAFIEQLTTRIQTLERALQDTAAERDTAQRRYASVKDEAYRQAANRMAEVLRVADQVADRLRRDSEEEARRRIADAEQRAAQILREAEDGSARLRQEGEEALAAAHAGVERMLGGLAIRRDGIMADMQAIRERMAGLIKDLEGTVAMAKAQDPIGIPARSRSADGPKTSGEVTPAEASSENGPGTPPMPAAPGTAAASGKPEGQEGPVVIPQAHPDSNGHPPTQASLWRRTEPLVAAPLQDPATDDLLGLPEGFDLIIPDFLRPEDER